MKKDDLFCSVDNYSVLIPYKDLEKLLTIANIVQDIYAMYDRLSKQYDALRVMFFELAEKLGDLQ